MARGDLLLFHNSGAWYDRIIVAATSGGNRAADYVHAAIDLGDGTILEATSSGIRVNYFHVDDRDRAERIPLKVAEPHRLELALSMALDRVGNRYGWVDIFDQLLKLIHCPFYVGRLHSLDCSDLAAMFAAIATDDLQLLETVLDARQEISPNDLARYYGLVK